MINDADGSKIINEIIKNNPEDEWLILCEKSLPDWSVGAIISTIEIACGGDVLEDSQ